MKELLCRRGYLAAAAKPRKGQSVKESQEHQSILPVTVLRGAPWRDLSDVTTKPENDLQAMTSCGLRWQVNLCSELAPGSLLIGIGTLEVPMSMTYSSSPASGDVASYGGFVDAVGGIATVVLAIIGLAGVKPEILISIATIVFGAALLIQGGAMLTEFATVNTAPEAGAPATGGGISALFLVGFAGIVLGVLALLGVHAAILTSISVIAFGSALVISSTAVWQLLTSRSVEARFQTRSPMLRVMASEVAAGSSGLQAMAGLAVIVLGILAVAGVFTEPLTLIALLVAGTAIVLTGSTLSGTMIGFMRPSTGTATTARVS
jgi:hypothetical protein